MLPDYRRPLIRPDLLAIAKAYADARAELHAIAFEHRCALADVLHEVEDLRAILRDVVTGLRQSADRDIASLRRELERALLRLAPPDGKPLN